MKISPYGNIFKDLEFYKKHYLNENQFNFSEKTKKSYERVINLFIDFCVDKQNEIEFHINEINKFIVNDFLFSINGGASTKSLYLTIIKAFFKYVSENNSDAVDLLEHIQNVKVKKEKKEPLFYTNDEIKIIKKTLKEKFYKTKSHNKKIKSFLVYLLIETGIRAGEVVNLSPKNIEKITYENEEYLKIKIFGKGQKERFVYLIPDMLIQDMIESFINYDFSNKITYSGLYTFNKTILQKINIKNKGLHAYRHYFARNWVENNQDLQTLSELLGHQSIMITSKYYARSSEKGYISALNKIKDKK